MSPSPHQKSDSILQSKLHSEFFHQTSSEFLGKSDKSFLNFLHLTFKVLHPFEKFIHSWYIDLFCEYLEQIDKGNIKRLIINIPPRCLKSIFFSVAWPAWLLGHDPSRKIIVVSYAQELSDKHSEDCNFLMSMPFYQEWFPGTIVSKKHNRRNKFLTTAQGFRLATSIEGRLTGEGADIIILDDPQTPTQAYSHTMRNRVNSWYKRTLLSRLNSRSSGVIVLLMQRLHRDDLTENILNVNKDVFTHVSLPLIAIQDTMFSIGGFSYLRKVGEKLSKRFSQEDIEQIRIEMGNEAFEIQYQQNTAAAQHSIILSEWLGFFTTEDFHYKKIYQKLININVDQVVINSRNFANFKDKSTSEYNSAINNDHKPINDFNELKNNFQDINNFQDYQIYQSWDCAIKGGEQNDYSVCTTWCMCGCLAYLVHLYRDRVNYPDLKRIIAQLVRIFQPSMVIVEDCAAGQQILQERKTDEKVRFVGVRPKHSKVLRAALASQFFANKRVFIPRDESIASILFTAASQRDNSDFNKVNSDFNNNFSNIIENINQSTMKQTLEYKPWLHEFIAEITNFPNTRNDDIVDSTSQFLLWLKEQESKDRQQQRSLMAIDVV